MRNRLFSHVTSLSLDYFETEKTGRIVARMTSDIDAMQELISQGLVLFVQNIFLFVGAVVLMLVLSWQLALGVLVIVPPVFFASRWFRRVSNKAYLEVRDSISTNLTTLQEGLEGVRVVQAYGRTGSFTERFGQTNEDQYEANMVTTRISAKYFPFIEYAGVGGDGGDRRVRRLALFEGRGRGRCGRRVRALPPAGCSSRSTSSASSTTSCSRRARRCRRSSACSTLPQRSRERPGAVDLPRHGEIDVDAVTFAYGTNEPVLHDVTLHIAPGERIASWARPAPESRRSRSHRVLLRPSRRISYVSTASTCARDE